MTLAGLGMTPAGIGFMNASSELLDGDAAYTPRQYRQPPGPDGTGLPDGQAADFAAGRGSPGLPRRLHIPYP